MNVWRNILTMPHQWEVWKKFVCWLSLDLCSLATNDYLSVMKEIWVTQRSFVKFIIHENARNTRRKRTREDNIKIGYLEWIVFWRVLIDLENDVMACCYYASCSFSEFHFLSREQRCGRQGPFWRSVFWWLLPLYCYLCLFLVYYSALPAEESLLCRCCTWAPIRQVRTCQCVTGL